MTNIVIYGRTNCKFCTDAKTLCEMNGFKYEWKDVSKPELKEELVYFVPNAKTIPQIFVNNKYIGGYDRFSEYVQQNMKEYGKLD